MKQVSQVIENPGNSLHHEPLLEIVQVDEEVLSILISLVCRKSKPVNCRFPITLDHIFFPQKIQFSQGVLRELVPLFRRGVQPADSPIYVFLCKELFPKAILCEGISPLR